MALPDNPTLPRMRTLAATLITCSGISRIAALWFRELTGEALVAALLGAVYLFIGIGLYGQSRFTLFVAIVIPATASALLLQHNPPAQFHALQWSSVTLDIVVILLCAVLLWRTHRTHKG